MMEPDRPAGADRAAIVKRVSRAVDSRPLSVCPADRGGAARQPGRACEGSRVVPHRDRKREPLAIDVGANVKLHRTRIERS